MRREPARRVFANEFNKSTYGIGGGDKKETFYLLTPLGLKCNRIFAVGVLLEKNETSEGSGIWRIRLSDPTGSFLGFIGKFQSEALESLVDLDSPEIVAVVAKTRLLHGNRTLPILRVEKIAASDFNARDYWIFETAKATLERIRIMEMKESEDAKLAWQIYEPDLEYYKRTAIGVLQKLKEEYEMMEESKDIKEIEEDDISFELDEEIFDIKDL